MSVMTLAKKRNLLYSLDMDPLIMPLPPDRVCPNRQSVPVIHAFYTLASGGICWLFIAAAQVLHRVP